MQTNASIEVTPDNISAKSALVGVITTPPLYVKLYSPNKILVATLLGGILGGCVLHWLNLKALQQEHKANQTLIWSIAFLIILPLFSILTHIQLSGAFGGAVAIGYKMDAKKTYGALYKQHADNNGKQGGWWATVGIGIGSLLISLGIALILSLIVTLALHK